MNVAEAYARGWTSSADARAIREEQDMLQELRRLERDRRWSVLFNDVLELASLALIVATFLVCCALWGL
jgi:hypothetical protein